MSTPTVLIIDPFPDEAELYALYFGSRGFLTRVHQDAEQALQFATTTPPDAVVTRPRQGGMGGVDVVTRLKSTATTRNVPVLMITTSIRHEDKESALQAGCDGYVLLPADPECLVSEIQRMLKMGNGNTPPLTAGGALHVACRLHRGHQHPH